MSTRIPFRLLRAAAAEPELRSLMLRVAMRKLFRVPWQRLQRQGTAGPISLVSVRLTYACNLSCSMCAQWGDSGAYHDKPADEIQKEIPPDLLIQRLHEIKDEKPHVYLWGGEPFLYKGLLDVLAAIKRMGLTVNLTTNGTLLAKHAQDLVDIGVDGVMVSLDGPEAQHNLIRGSDRAFANVVAGIEALGSAKAASKTKRPFTVILSTVTRQNVDALPELVETATSLPVDAVTLYLSWFTTPSLGRRHESFMTERGYPKPTAWQGWPHSIESIPPPRAASLVDALKQKRWSAPLFVVPDLNSADQEAYFTEPDHTFAATQCYAPWLETDIMPNGDVVTCRDYPDVVVGSIHTQSLAEIWNGEPMRKFRQLLNAEGLLPTCARCCGLIGL